MHRNVTTDDTVSRINAVSKYVLKVWGVIGEFEDVMITLYELLMSVEPGEDWQVLSVDDDISEVIYAVLGLNKFIPFFDNVLIMFLNAAKGSNPRSILSTVNSELDDVVVSEVGIGYKPGVLCHRLYHKLLTEFLKGKLPG